MPQKWIYHKYEELGKHEAIDIEMIRSHAFKRSMQKWKNILDNNNATKADGRKPVFDETPYDARSKWCRNDCNEVSAGERKYLPQLILEMRNETGAKETGTLTPPSKDDAQIILDMKRAPRNCGGQTK